MKNFLFLAFLMFATQSFSQTPFDTTGLTKVFVVAVFDGDGCRAMMPDSTIRKIRFASIDAPERANNLWCSKNQPYSEQSRDSLRSLILNKWIWLDTVPFRVVKYSYDRQIADVYLLDGTFLQEVCAAKGWAWALSLTGRTNPDLTIRINLAAKFASDNKLGFRGLSGRKYTPAYWRVKYKRG